MADRNYYVTISFNPTAMPLTPCGQVKFFVAGAPPEGIVCALPSSWTSRTRSLVFRLRLSKDGATEREMALRSAFYRQPSSADTEEDEEEEEQQQVSPAVVPLAAVPLAVLAAMPSEDAPSPVADPPPANPPPVNPPPANPPSPRPPSVADAAQAAVRAAHLELNLGMPEAADGSMAARARELLCLSDAPLPGEGAAVVEPPSDGDVPAEHADAMGEAAVAVDAAAAARADAASTEDEEDKEDEADDDGAAAALSDDSMESAPLRAPSADAGSGEAWAAALATLAPPPPASPREGGANQEETDPAEVAQAEVAQAAAVSRTPRRFANNLCSTRRSLADNCRRWVFLSTPFQPTRVCWRW